MGGLLQLRGAGLAEARIRGARADPAGKDPAEAVAAGLVAQVAQGTNNAVDLTTDKPTNLPTILTFSKCSIFLN